MAKAHGNLSSQLLARITRLVKEAHPNCDLLQINRAYMSITEKDSDYIMKARRYNNSKMAQSFIAKCASIGMPIVKKASPPTSKLNFNKPAATKPSSSGPSTPSTQASEASRTPSKSSPSPIKFQPTSFKTHECSWQNGTLRSKDWSCNVITASELCSGKAGIALMSMHTFSGSSIGISATHNEASAILLPEIITPARIMEVAPGIYADRISIKEFIFVDPSTGGIFIKKGRLVQLHSEMMVEQLSAEQAPLTLRESCEIDLTVVTHADLTTTEAFRSASKSFKSFIGPVIDKVAPGTSRKLGRIKSYEKSMEITLKLNIGEAHKLIMAQLPLNEIGTFIRPTRTADIQPSKPNGKGGGKGGHAEISLLAAQFSLEFPVIWFAAEEAPDYRAARLIIDKSKVECVLARKPGSPGCFGARFHASSLAAARTAFLKEDARPPLASMGVVGTMAFELIGIPHGIDINDLQESLAEGRCFGGEGEAG